MKKKKVAMIWCHYKGSWTPMGRARKNCPVCGAFLRPRGDVGHKIRKR